MRCCRLRGRVSDEVMARLRLFFAERVEFYLREVRGQAYDVAKAVMVSGQDDLRDLVARAEAVTAVRSGENAATFLAVAAAFKRMRNILEQAVDRDEEVAESVDAALLKDDAERQLNETGAVVASEVRVAGDAAGVWVGAGAIAGLRPVVDAFFDRVMVMAPEPEMQGESAGAGGQDGEGLFEDRGLFGDCGELTTQADPACSAKACAPFSFQFSFSDQFWLPCRWSGKVCAVGVEWWSGLRRCDDAEGSDGWA